MMKCVSAFAIFFLSMAVLLDFIAVSVTAWFSFHTKSDLSLLLQWSGLYQTCTHGKDCEFDLWTRRFESQLVFFMMNASILILVIGIALFFVAIHKSQKNLFLLSGCFSIAGGLIIVSSTVVYTVNTEWEFKDPGFNGVPSFSSCYFISWAAAVASIIAGVALICLRQHHTKGIAPLPLHVQPLPYPSRRRRRQSLKINSHT